MLIFRIFTKKTRAEISRRMVQFSCRDLSYETDSGPKTETVSDLKFPSDADGGDDVPTTLPSGQTPGLSRPGTKYPVRGNPSHFDDFSLFCDLHCIRDAVKAGDKAILKSK